MQDLPVDKLLAPFYVLQWVAALLVVGGLALAVYRGTRDRRLGEPKAEQRYFFDGPLAEALKLLRDNRNHLGRIVEMHEKQSAEQRDQTELLRAQNGLLAGIKDLLESLPSLRRRR